MWSYFRENLLETPLPLRTKILLNSLTSTVKLLLQPSLLLSLTLQLQLTQQLTKQ